MAKLTSLIGSGLHPDDLWRNFAWLRERVERLEHDVRQLKRPWWRRVWPSTDDLDDFFKITK